MKKWLYILETVGFLALLATGLVLGWLPPAAFCLVLVGSMLYVLIRDLVPAEIALTGTLVLLMLGDLLAPVPFLKLEAALRGFSNPGVLTVGALFVVAGAVRNTGLFESLARGVLGNKTSGQSPLFRMAGLIAGISAFINNTPIVSIFLPMVREWALKHSLSPSKFLLPLSYFTIFGGACTLVGTSTNLVVHGLASDQHITISFFSFAWVGIPCGLIGIAYLVWVGHKWLPENRDPFLPAGEDIKQYLVEMFVEEDSRMAGLSVEKAGLRELEELFLFEVRRGKQIFAPIKREFVLQKGDCLVFVGSRDSVLNLPKINGLTMPQACRSFDLGSNAQLVEVVISSSSPLKGRTVDDVWFNRKYDAAVLGIHRNGEPIRSSISTTSLASGDTLLLVAGMGFRRIWQNSTDFYLVSPIRTDIYKPQLAYLSAGIVLLMVLLPFFNLVPLVITSFAAAILLVLIGCIRKENVLQLVDWNVMAVIAAAFGISAALEGSGASALIAKGITGLSTAGGPLVALLLVYLATNILTEVITNNASAALLFPVALTTARELDASPMPFIMGVAIAASASFSSPIGYQTNLMVYGPGGYKFKHYLRVGSPLNALFLVGTLLIAPVVWPF